MNEKIMVFGKGFLGTRISEELGFRLVGRDEIDPSNFSALEKYLDSEKPDAIIDAIVKIGYPNADWCETHHGETLESNILVPANLSRACEERGIYLVHLSSGCIYNGDNGGKGFSESDKPNFYGPSFHLMTKILAEKILEGSQSLILRLKLPVDDRPHPRNLITKLSGYKNILNERNSITTVPHMIKAIETLVNKEARGTYNLVNPGTISFTEIREMYQAVVDSSQPFKTISLSELDTITVGKRSRCYLNTEKLKAEGINLPEIHDAVRECLIKYKEKIK